MSRRFGEEIPSLPAENGEILESGEKLCEWIWNDEIGRDAIMKGPFGNRKITYCDYTASARAISAIEDYIRNEVLPFYGNTHSSVTVTAEQTTLFMHEARQEIRAMTGAGDLDDIIFTGNGATSAVELLIHLMNIENIEEFVVVHSSQEHHSNLLPWRNLGIECLEVKEDSSGRIDVLDLQNILESISGKRIIGAFTACSNVTGILNNIEKISQILKKFGALSIWDFASAAPYINISFTSSIDAIFFSGHKFPGGVSSPGVLIIKKALCQAKTPKRIGGGTVIFVSKTKEWYLKENSHREEGGTADAIGAVRLAMAAKLKRSVGENIIAEIEQNISSMVIRTFKEEENLILLGPATRRERIPVFSFLVKEPKSGLFFHHNYISALLNDLFGIQTRSGCMCAGPYAQKLLGIDEKLADRFVDAIREASDLDRLHLRRSTEYSEREFLRPGFTRISFAYFTPIETIRQILKALQFVAQHAADFLHLYQVNCESGEWHHKNQRVFHGRKWLGHARFTKNGLMSKEDTEEFAENLENILKSADNLANDAAESIDLSKTPDARSAIDSKYSDLRWFVLPIEIAEYQKFGKLTKSQKSVIQPKVYEDVSEEIEEEISPQISPENNPEFPSEEEFVCPLNPEIERKRGIQGDIEDEKEAEEVRETEDWNKRVIVRKVELSKEEESRIEWHNPPLEMYKKVTDVIHQLEMIKNGDKILVCLSGGKDSLSLLHILHFYQQRCKKAKSTVFELGAITIDPGSSEYNPRPLIEYCRSLNIDYFYEEQDIIGAAKKVEGLRSICAFCSRMKRGRLAAAAQLHGWNVLAMGQHLDDLAESFLIGAFQNGSLTTMKAQYSTKDQTLRVIRPLVFVREKALRNFAEEKKLPIVAENCPACFNQATERHRIKQLLAQQELVFPDLFNSLRSALRPLLLVDSAHTDQMRLQAVENILKHKN
ncbi:unnamed protein product [Caenorhabditis angaria]|uniref:Aminotransferase class V domain-containing protein n=1 Tax=Caenorhabditis angaria TaxID=860376 RepID=A0A9P1N2F2_9PELO|nr:unnamed protein product [Caenorhabditis angaria]